MEDDFNELDFFSPDALGNPQPAQREIAEERPTRVPVLPTISADFGEPQETKPINPLKGYFRLPALSLTLPSKGAFFPEGTIVGEGGTVQVFPMRAADEILLNSPDALMNNTAITNLIASCVPAIKEPNHVSAPDLTALLIAIRIASTGPKMELMMQCPECSAENEFELDLPTILNDATEVPVDNIVRMNDEVLVYLAPYTLHAQTKILNAMFSETRLAQALDVNETMPQEEKELELGKIMARMRGVVGEGITRAITKVVVPNAEVTDYAFIKEYIDNIDSRSFNRIKEELEKINNSGVDTNFHAHCKDCQHEWTGAIDVNPSTFFDLGSSG